MRRHALPKKNHRVDWQIVVLLTLQAVGMISVAILAPNALQMFKIFEKKNSKKQSIGRAIQSLEKKGLIEKNSAGKYVLTKKGDAELKNYEFQTSRKRKRWDGLWRVIIFDIEETRKSVRNRVREYLRNTGFSMVQKSVWVYPYPCNEIIELLKTEFNLENDMFYLVTKHIDVKTEEFLKGFFELK